MNFLPGLSSMTGTSLREYDVILVNSSAGKDSQTMLDAMVREAQGCGLRDRVVVVHANLGRCEWPRTPELARRQTERYGLRFVEVTRRQGDILQQVEGRGKWPSADARYCTSDHKRSQVYRALTMLSDEHRARATRRPIRILNCLGLRAEESPARAKRIPFGRDKQASNGRRMVDTYLPIHHWTTAEVWQSIRESGVEHHRAYDLGMPRLSCVFCIFSPAAALILAGHHNRDLLDEYVRIEASIGHDFKHKHPIRDIQAAIDRGECPGKDQVASWCM